MLYPIAIERGDDTTAHGVVFPDVDGCVSASDNYNDIILNATEAITGHLSVLADMGEKIPLATTIDAHIENPEYAGMVWALVDVDVSRYLGKTEKINVSLPSVLIHLIDEKVASNKTLYKSRSAYLAKLAEDKLIVG